MNNYFKCLNIEFLNYKLAVFILICTILGIRPCLADEGYGLWLSYEKIKDKECLASYQNAFGTVYVLGDSPTLSLAQEELQRGLSVLLDKTVHIQKRKSSGANSLIVASQYNLARADKQLLKAELTKLRDNSFLIKDIKKGNRSLLYVVGKDDVGTLYGVFHLLRLLQTNALLAGIDQYQQPKVQWRMLNHWDNLNRTVERGYAGLSIWKWDELPKKIDQRYRDYARANASVGINAVAINNVNASPQILSPGYLKKVTALADVFRPYGIRVFISINFASPRILGKLETADPVDTGVQQWWKEKVDEIYGQIPDFGGFLVKANSEGQPGPQDYGRTHVDGANMLASALAPHNGLLIWRAFVFESNNKDRVKGAYDEFIGFDG
ncbi:MAG TPA: alpha-glucuronidase family glycosyl hydrolase, partial [Sphingobacterium sp.]|nr:alpha-glucuronidase family glycosyl hydrolase [Sphingobacterium sp.]